jgi:hypothetical protein
VTIDETAALRQDSRAMPDGTFGGRFLAVVRAELHSTGPWSYEQIRRIEDADREVLAPELYVTCPFLPTEFTQRTSIDDPETLGRLFADEFRRHQEKQARLMSLDAGVLLDAMPIDKRLILGLKHFGVVGVGFSLGLAWLLSLPVHLFLVRVLHRAPWVVYSDAFLMTLLAIAIIAGATALGNALFRRTVAQTLSVRAFLLSALLYTVMTLAFRVQEASVLVRPLIARPSLLQEHPAMLQQLLMALSLLVLRLIAIPGAYALMGWKMLGPRDP